MRNSPFLIEEKSARKCVSLLMASVNLCANVGHFMRNPTKVMAWLDGKQEEIDNRFYRSNQQPRQIYDADPLRRIMSKYVRTERTV